jgi:hypothetical protein
MPGGILFNIASPDSSVRHDRTAGLRNLDPDRRISVFWLGWFVLEIAPRSVQRAHRLHHCASVAVAQPPGRSIVMRGLLKAIVLSATTALVCAPSVARADGFINPWAGVNFGSNISNSRAGFGVNAGGMGAGVVGGEVAFGYNPSFFGTSGDFGNNTELDLMANLLLGIPIGGTHGASFRPYVTGGLGLIRQQIDGGTVFKVSSAGNDWGWNLGLGAMGFFSDHVGVRGDVRYLRTFSGNFIDGFDQGNLHFWRTSIGLVIR